MSLKENINLAREKAGLTKQELAEAIGKSPNYIYQIEGGSRPPPIQLVAKIADALGTSVSTLMAEDEIVMRIRAEVLEELGASQIEEARAHYRTSLE